KNKTILKQIIDFSGYPVFEATVDTNIILFQKKEPTNDALFKAITVGQDFDIQNISEYIQKRAILMEQAKLKKECYVLAEDRILKLKEKIELIGKPLKDWDVKIYRGILTGYNEAFIIDNEKREEILRNCKDEDERKRTEEIIKPILRGRDIGRYYYKWAGLWVIFIPWHFPLHNDYSIQGASQKAEKEFQDKYPSIYSHLLTYKKALLNRNKDETGIRYEWYALQRCAATYYPEFEKEKIVWQRVTQQFSFCYIPGNLYVLDSMAFLTGKHIKYLLGILNSKTVDWYVKTYIHLYADAGFLLSNQYVERIIIPPITPQNQSITNQIESIVSQILSFTQSDDYLSNPQKQAKVKELEREIDQLVYKLYDLTEEEIKIIEGNQKEI
ncbi:MAG: TaqI-like C-terminal specificity domain-containing protein, partial [candidate division WOR-3 bacterium]